MPENPFIPPLNLPGPGQRVRYAGQDAGSPTIETGPVTTQPPHAAAETNPIKTPSLETRVYWPQLIVNGGESTTFEVTVTAGKVVERIVVTGDAIAYHQADNHFDPADPVLKKFGISVGQSVYVKVEVLPTGAIGIEPEVPPLDPPPPPVTLVVSAAGEESTHYEPPIGDSEGSPGTYYYELARLISDSFGVRFRYNMAGRNIDHWMDLPTFKVRAGANPWKEWNAEEGVYYSKGFIGAGQITLTENEDDLTYQGNKRNLEVRFREADASEPEADETLNFEDGLSMDGEVDAAPATERDIILPIVSGISPIMVNRVGEGERNFQVSYDGDEFPGGASLVVSVQNGTVNEFGFFAASGSPQNYYWQNGLYVGTTEPPDFVDADEMNINSVNSD